MVARSLEPREETLKRLFRELLIAGPLALLLASLAGYGLAAAALRPVEAMRRRAAAVTAAAPGRLPVPPAKDEVSRLATTLNDMLARLQGAFEHERRFVSDASHELRTPLALLRTELELALRRPRSPAELEEALRSAAEETERLSRLAEDLLLIARADQGALPIRREAVPAAEVLAPVAARFTTRTRQLGRSVRTEDTDASSTPIRNGSSRRSGTSSTTRSPTAPAPSSSSPTSATTWWSCTSSTTGRAFRRTSSRARSTASAAQTRRAGAAAPASASRSWT